MQISRRFFTYPVLANDPIVNAYSNKKIQINLDIDEDSMVAHLNNICWETDSDYLVEQYNKNLIKFVCVIECPQTFFKRTYELSEHPINIDLQKADLNGKVEISLIVYALIDFKLKSSDEFQEDYRDIDFELDKYQIIAYDNGFSFPVNHSEDNDTVAKSIFSIIPILDSTSKDYNVEIKNNKILISMSKPIYDKYRKLSNVSTLAEEFFCSLLIPSLIEGINKCKAIANSKDEPIEKITTICDKFHWFSSVLESYLRLEGKDLTLEDFKTISSIELAQKVLGSPIERALDTIIQKMKSEENDDE